MEELELIVQRMIDAGESEQNIASVIQSYNGKKPTSPAKETASVGLQTPAVDTGYTSAIGSSAFKGTKFEGDQRLLDYEQKLEFANQLTFDEAKAINEEVNNINFEKPEFSFGSFLGDFWDSISMSSSQSTMSDEELQQLDAQLPYQKELKQAKDTLIKAGNQNPSKEEIENQARSIIKNNLIADRIGRNREEILEDLESDYGTFFGEILSDRIAGGLWKKLPFINYESDYEKIRGILEKSYGNKSEAAAKEFKRIEASLMLDAENVENAVKILDDYTTKLNQNKKLTEQEQEDYNNQISLIQGFNANSSNQIKRLNDLSDKVSDFNELADLSKRSYSTFEITDSEFNARAIGIISGLTELAGQLTDSAILDRFGVDINDPETYGILPEKLKPILANQKEKGARSENALFIATDWLKDEADKITNGIERRQDFGKIESVEDFFEFTGTLFTEQAANLAVTYALPTSGLAIISASAAGDKLHEMRMEEETTGKKYTPAQWYGSAISAFAAEYITEKVSLGQATRALKYNYKKAFDIVDPNYTLDIAKMSAKTAFGKWAVSAASEGGAEGAAQFINNVSDKYLLDKDISLTEGLTESFFSGAIMSGLGFAAPVLVGDLAQAAMTDTALIENNKRVKEIISLKQQIDKLSSNLADNPEVASSIEILQQKHDQLVVEQQNALQQVFKGVDNLSNNDKRTLLNIDTSLYKLKGEIDKINKDTNLSADQKKSLIESKIKLINKIKAKKDSVINNAQYSKEQKQARIFQEKLIAENNLKVEIVEADTQKEAIQKTKDVINNSNLDPEVKKQLIEQIDKETSAPGFYTHGFTVGAEFGLPITVQMKNNATDGARGNSTVFSHELGHGVLFNKLLKQGADVVAMVDMLEDYARKNIKGANEIFDSVKRNYKDLDPRSVEYAEERFLALKDVYSKRKDALDLTFRGKLFKAWNKLKGKDNRADNEVKNGQDVLDLMTSFASSFEKGEISGSFKALLEGRLKTVKAETAQKVKEGTIKKSQISLSQEKLNNRVDDLVGNKSDGKYTWGSKEEWQMSEEFANTYEQIIGGNLIDPLIRRGIEGDSVYGVSIEDFVLQVKDKLSDLILNFDPTKNNSLIGYINSQLSFRKGDVLNKLKAKQPTQAKSIDTEAGEAGAVTGMEMMSTEEADAGIELEERAAREEAEVKQPLVKRLKFKDKPAIINKIKTKLAERVKYRISLFDAAKSKNKFTTDFVRDIHKDLQEVTYEAVLDAIGYSAFTAEQMENFLRDNYVSILDGLTTTYLSRAFPEAIEKKIVGEGYVKYPKWKGAQRGAKPGDVDFWKATEEGPFKGNTSGPQKIRRIKNIANEITPVNFVGKYIKNGEIQKLPSIALAKQIGAELGIDLLIEDIRNNGDIAQALFERQELIRGMASSMAAADVIYQLERPGIKFSKVGNTGFSKLDDARRAHNKYLFNLPSVKREKILAGELEDPKYNKLYDALEAAHDEYLGSAQDNLLTETQQEKYKKFLRYEFDNLQKLIEAQVRYNDYSFTQIVNDVLKGAKTAIKKITSDDIGYDNKSKAKRENYKNDVRNILMPYADNLIYDAKTKNDKAAIINELIEFIGGSYAFKGFLNNAEFKKEFIDPIAEKHGLDPDSWTLETVIGGQSIFYKGNKVATIYKQEAGAVDIASVIKSKDTEITNTIDIKERNKNAKHLAKRYVHLANHIKQQYKKGNISLIELARISNALHSGYMRSAGKALAQIKGIVLYDGLYDPKDYTYEHTPPSNTLKRAFFLYAIGVKDLDLQRVVDNSSVVVLPTKVSNIVDEIYQSSMGKDYKPGDDFQTILENRYYDPVVQKLIKQSGFDLSPNTIQDPNSEYLVRSSKISEANIRFSLNTKVDDNGKPVYFYPEYSDMEDLDSPIYSWTSDLFKVGPLKDNQYYSVEASVLRGKNGPGVDIMFGLIETGQTELNMAKTTVSITNQFKDNSRSPLKVFSIVGNALLDFLKENPQYNFVQFSGQDVSRVRLYDRLARMLAKELGWKFDVKREVYKETRDGVEVNVEISEYEIAKPASIKQSKASKQRQKLIDNNNNLLPANQRLKGKNISNQEVLRKMKGLDDKEANIRLSKINNSMLDKQMNIMLEQTTGVQADSEYSDARAKAAAQFAGKKFWWIPPSAQDFMGLMYKFIGKGKVGDAQLKWIEKNLINPYARANEEITRARRAMYRDYKALKEQLNIVPKDLRERIPGSDFTVEQAVRAYIFTQEGHEVPGLSEKEARELKQYVAQRADLIDFATKIRSLLKGTQMAKPRPSWLGGTITTDLLETLNTTARAQALAEWQANVDVIFSKKNLNKIEAIYGSNFRYALENILNRMKTGKNRNYGPDSLTGRFMDWVNNQTGTIMFFNTRSAVLQTISSINFLNWTDNNPLQAAAAFANQKQYWTDFWDLFNSDFLVDRRDGLRMEVNENDIADMAKKGYGFQSMVGKLLKAGFLPTQIADSFAIAAGGATFYRNRLNRYIKEGMDPDKAKELAFREFRETAEESQQSSRPDKISQQQAGNLGRFVLAFANTPAQYARLMNKAFLDLKNGRGDAKTNISKILYYGAVQNILFNALQQALFALAFDDEDEEETDERYLKIANGMGDSVLRGMGIHGAIISTLKNTAIKLYTESQKGRNAEYGLNLITELAGISPPVQSKIRKLKSAGKSVEYNLDDMKKMGWDIDNPAYLAGANVIAATTNLPTDRVIKKTQNINEALTGDIEMMQRIALLSGWGKWELGLQEKKSKNKNSSGGFKKGGFKKGGF